MKNRILLAIIVINITITSLHYTDNAWFIDLYPEPEWLSTSRVFITWGIMTIIALISYWLYVQKNYWLSYLSLIIYSITGLSSPTHYLYGGLSEFTFKMHCLIWSDFIVGLSVIGFIMWSGLIKREWQQNVSY